MESSCLVLDFDGAILDTEESLFRAWSELWEDHGQHLAVDEWQRNIGTEDVFDPRRELEQRRGRPFGTEVEERRRARRDEIQSRFGPRPGVLDWLSQAERAAVPVGMASSSPLDWVEDHLERLGLRRRIACLVCRDDVMPAKPSPLSYLAVCARLSSDPAVSVAVEDSPNGGAAAVAAGLFTVATPHGLTNDLDLSAADLTVVSLRELDLAEALDMAARRPEQ